MYGRIPNKGPAPAKAPPKQSKAPPAKKKAKLEA